MRSLARKRGDNACPGPQPNSSRLDLSHDGNYKLWNGNGRSGKLSHSSDVIGACIYLLVCVCVWLHPFWVRGQCGSVDYCIKSACALFWEKLVCPM